MEVKRASTLPAKLPNPSPGIETSFVGSGKYEPVNGDVEDEEAAKMSDSPLFVGIVLMIL